MIPATLFFAPFVNSYKRFRIDSLAGVTESWGIDNRTVSLRVLNSSPAACRLENRVDNLLIIARMELGVFDSAVTDLERRRYFEMA